MDVNSPDRLLDLNLSDAKTEIRKDYLHEYYVLVAPKRRDRPFDKSTSAHPLVESAASPRLDLQKSVMQYPVPGDDWTTKVVENKFPALSLTNPLAYGMQEIVIDTPLRNVAFGELEVNQIGDILVTYQKRSQALHASDHIKYVAIFRNDGAEAGASLAHAHSQIAALPLIPPKFVSESVTIEAYAKQHSIDPFQQIIDHELKSKDRIIAESEHWVCFAPYASQWQMEVWFLPKTPITLLEDATEAQLRDLSPMLKSITYQLNQIQASYNLSVDQGISQNQRLMLKIRGRRVVSPRGGLEVGTELIINVIPPEAAADWYRRGLNLS